MTTAYKILLLLQLATLLCSPVNASPLKRNAPANVPAQPPKHHHPAPALRGEEEELLRQAYFTLFRADHDYDGHRIRAMEQTAHAARILGMELRGDGPAGERQGASDQQLSQAKALLEQALSLLATHHRPRAAEFVNNAIRHINIALRIA
jgi:hypothetical protein